MQALALVPAPGHEVQGSVLCWRASVRLWQGRWQDALADAQAAQQVAEIAAQEKREAAHAMSGTNWASSSRCRWSSWKA